jgi:hypothetical protein
VFGGQRHGGHVDVATFLEPLYPSAFGVILCSDNTCVRPSPVHQESSKVSISLSGDLPESSTIAAGMLAGRHAKGCGESAATSVHTRVANTGNQCRGGLRANCFNFHQTAGRIAGFRELADLVVILCDVRARLLRSACKHPAGYSLEGIPSP